MRQDPAVRPHISCPPWCTISGSIHTDDYDSATHNGLLCRIHGRTLAENRGMTVEITAMEVAAPDGTGPIVGPPAIALFGHEGDTNMTAEEARWLAAELIKAANYLDTI